MAILQSTGVTGSLSVTGSLNTTEYSEEFARKLGIIGSFTWDSSTSSPQSAEPRVFSQKLEDMLYSKIRGCVMNDNGSIQYYLDPTDWSKKIDSGSSDLTGADGQVMVEIPKFYTKREKVGTKTTWSISPKKVTGYHVHPAFIKDGIEVDNRYVGAYTACIENIITGSIAATTEDNPVKVSTTVEHNLITNGQVTIDGTGVATLDGNKYVITKVDSGSFTLNGVDGTGIGTSSTGSFTQDYLSGLNLDNAGGLATTGSLASVKGIYPIVGLTRGEARLRAADRGTVWRQMDFALWSAVNILYLVEYQTFYSQDVLGDGNTNGSYLSTSADQDDSPHTIAGAGDAWGNGSTDGTQPSAGAKPGTAYMKYRGIENWFGNTWQWVDGINININATGDVYVSNTAADFADDTDTNYTLIASDWDTVGNDWITDWSDIDDYFIANANTGGSSSTYVTDYNYGSTSADRVMRIGAGGDNGAVAGAFAFDGRSSSGTRNRFISTRLAR